ncbi:MAG: (Fe-S)-binding protein [Deltaproteobacteria bacterium]|nr:(Fe-S)-binding protein [Myxococcales bacterium]MDP3216824.1 (Fe-S)-binding protein [Deltaproteobacteria bacterium]
MNRRLPLLEGRAEATTRCTYCPKLCRPACPVSTVEGRETVTPWGKMRAMDELLRDVEPAEEASRAAMAWACTGCGRCRTLCLLDNPVVDTLYDGRADALANEIAPAPVSALVAGWDERRARLEADARGAGLVGEGAAVAVVPGCRAVREDPAGARRTVRAVSELGGCGAHAVGGECCGAPLWDAGDREGFFQQAARFVAAVGDRATDLVVADSGCAWTLRTLYPRFDLAPERWARVEHLAETAARHLDRLRPLDVDGTVAVHDSCRLGRGLGVYDAPRQVMERILGRAPVELPNSREQASCSGGGGLLPITRPATSRAIAAELAGEVREAGDDVGVVTTCTSSRSRLRRAGVRADDLAEWVARSLGVTGDPG